jgi:HEAT repeat protein
VTTMGLADNATIGTLLTNIKHGDTTARMAAVRHAALVGTDALLPLGRVYAGTDSASGKAAFEAMKRIAYNAGRPGAPEEAKAASESLLTLTSAVHSRQVRADALELLGIVGSATEVKAIAALMDDKEVGEDARLALQRIPGKAAEDALRAAARGAGSDRRAAIELSLRHRKLKRGELGVKK